MTQIAASCQAQTGLAVRLNFGSSGQLAAQITQGAPVDAFISAASREMDQLAAAGLIDPSTRRDICGNELVLIVPHDAATVPGSFVPASFEDLTDPRIHRIAVGQPRTVPAGQYAAEVFDHLKITAALGPRLVFGENVRQVLDYVERGEVDAGIVYATDAAEAGTKVQLAARADASWHSPIVYPAAVVKPSANAAAAGRFLDFVCAPQSRHVLEEHGFVVASPATAPSP